MSNPQRLLIVHPDASVRTLLCSMLRTLGHQIDEAENDRVALRQLDHNTYNLLLVGCEGLATSPVEGEIDALELLAYVRRKFAGTPVVLLAVGARPERAREAVIRGADRVLRYPIAASQLRAAVSQSIEGAAKLAFTGSLAEEKPPRGDGDGDGAGAGAGNGQVPTARVSPPTRDAGLESDVEDLIGVHPTLRQALELAEAIAPSRAPVLIVGERGTGKRLLARRLHALSPRHSGPFVEVVCSSASPGALEADLFGRRSAVEGEPDEPGKVAQAKCGTLVLHDTTNLPPSLQHRLLQLIRDGEYLPMGSITPRRSDCRFVLCAHEDRDGLVDQERFRSDLRHVLSVVTLNLPPLRQRGGDIARLATYLATRFARESGRPPVRFSEEAIRLLESHPWPGNVRELKSVVERAVQVCRDGTIAASRIELAPREPSRVRAVAPSVRRSSSPELVSLKEALEEPERQIILDALRALNWNRQKTAMVLDINRTTLYKKMKKYGLLFEEPVWAN